MRVGMSWVALLLLAGCAGGAGAAEEPEAYKGLAATKDTGVIRGLVVNELVVPVEGATITLRPGDLQTGSDAEGAFGFADLAPGVYFLSVSAPYHTTVQASTEVEAGDDAPPLTRVRLQTIAKPEPRIQALTYQFNLDGSVWLAGVGVVANTALTEGTYAARFDVAANATWIQSELVWTPAQPLAERLYMVTWLAPPGSNEDFADEGAAGTSPLVHAWKDPDQTQRAGRIGYTLFVRDGTYPVGFTVSQDVSLFIHVFQHFTPDEGWTFVRDGEHPLPP